MKAQPAEIITETLINLLNYHVCSLQGVTQNCGVTLATCCLLKLSLLHI